METVTTRIPEDEKKLLEEMSEEEGAAQSEVLRRIIQEGLENWRKQRALKLLSKDKVSVRRAAEMAGVSYVEMLDLASEEEVGVGYSEEDLESDLERI